jgi:hypothetical protein
MASEPATNVGFLACTIPSPQLASRRAEIQTLIDQAGSAQARHDGVQMTFQNSEEVAQSLLEFIRLEQQCCKTITYELRSEPPHTELSLRLRAPAALISPVQSFYLGAKPSNQPEHCAMAKEDLSWRVGS